MSSNTQAVLPYLKLLIYGASDQLLTFFAGKPDVDDPFTGRLTGADAVGRLARERHRWLRDHQAQVETTRIMHGSISSLEEATLRLNIDGTSLALPVATVLQRDQLGGLDRIRLYHSTQAFPKGSSRPRGAAVPAPVAFEIPESIEIYQIALSEGQLDRIVSQFEEDASIQESRDHSRVHRGREEIREFYRRILSEGSIQMDDCQIIQNGACCGIEYNVVKQGQSRAAPQAGFSVYEWGAQGKLSAVRIYDDLIAPAL